MSDYLEGIVQRSVGAGGTVLPRLPSLFEPVAASTEDAAIAVVDPYHVDVDAGTPPAAGALPQAAAAPPPAAAAPPPPVVRRSPPVEFARRPIVAEIEKTASRAPAPASGVAATPVRVAAASDLSPDHQATAARERASVACHQAPATPAFASRPGPAPIVSTASVSATPFTPEPTVSVSGTGSRRTLVPLAPPMGSTAAGRRSHAAGVVAAASAPAIRVTIGRVDVRAVVGQPQPSRVPTERRPRLSLDDYLKQRSGEGS